MSKATEKQARGLRGRMLRERTTMSDIEWTTIRVRARAVEKIDEIRQTNSSTPIPSKTSRSDVVEAALDLYARSLAITPPPPAAAPKKKPRG